MQRLVPQQQEQFSTFTIHNRFETTEQNDLDNEGTTISLIVNGRNEMEEDIHSV
jgi:hypothetical protein